MLKLERHRLGPRVFVCGRRVHEWHLGVLVIVSAAAVGALGLIALVPGVVAAVLGLWLIVKDWPDLTNQRRDTAGWRLGLHRRPLPLRPARRLDDVPSIAALATAVVGFVDLGSAITPNVSWRGRALVHLEPFSVMRDAHALAVPTSFALVLTAYYLYRRRSAALHIALVLMIVLTVFNVIKGLDIEEAVLTLSCALLLWASRSSFYGRREPGSLRFAILRIPALLAGAFVTALAVVGMAAPANESAGAIVRETGDLLLWQPGPFGFQDELARTGLAVELISLLTLLVAAYLLFRPLAAPRELPDWNLRRAAERIVHKHGTDTLAFFKLRTDKHYLFNADQTAFVGYRTESGVMMISGDPVGDSSAVDDLMQTVVAFAEGHSLRIAALGVSPAGRALFAQMGLRALYIGDEAIVDPERFTLTGRAIRKVRQSVARLEKGGFSAHLAELGSLDEAVMVELEQVAEDWRRGAAERGFSMAMDSLRNPHSAETLVLYATDREGTIRGFLHFVPSYGRNAVSLSFMRRRHDTPNGLTEFMIVEAIERLRVLGVAEVSLNFSVFARLLREPHGVFERLVGRLLVLGDAWFQIERLYRFNAKFFPRWEPRYFMYERRFGLPRAGLAALWLEGQLPRPTLRPGRRMLSAGQADRPPGR